MPNDKTNTTRDFARKLRYLSQIESAATAPRVSPTSEALKEAADRLEHYWTLYESLGHD